MKRILVRFILALVLSLMLLGMAVTPVSADGMGVAPSVLTIKSAAPGQDYIETILVYNTSDTDKVFSLSSTGDIASWVTFYPLGDHTLPITQLAIPANDRVYSDVKFSIPANASPLVYQGQLLAGAPTPTDTGEGAHVQIQLPINVIIEMVGAPDVIPTTTTTAFVPTIMAGELNLMSLNYVGQPVAGQLTKLQANLRNLTGTATMAYLTAEVYSGDKLVDTIKSDTLSIPGAGAGDSTLTIYYKFQKAGDYTIKGQVVYNGQLTQQQTLQLKVSGSGASLMPLMAIIGVALGVLLVVGIVLLFFKRNRRKIEARG